jgi:hypothetical protein
MKTIKTLCRRCGNQTGTIEKESSKKDAIIDKRRYCYECVKKSKDRMRNDNPAKRPEIKEKISRTLKQKYSSKEISSPFLDPFKLKEIQSLRRGLSEKGSESIRQHMRHQNPMFSDTIKKRAMATVKKKILTGEITYKRGHDHPLYKGTRTFSNDCRKWLKIWIRSILERDKFSCIVCGRVGGYLHTHHIRPLREIIKKVLTDEGIVDIVDVKWNSITEYERLIKKVVSDHKMEDGMTVCKQCHANIDDRYRRIKKSR